jgi:hypothetical protein
MDKRIINRWTKIFCYLAAAHVAPALAEDPSQPPPSQPEVAQPATEPETPAVQPVPTPAEGTVEAARPISVSNEAARYLAGLHLSPGSPLGALAESPRWAAHSQSMNSAFSTLDQRQLSNIRVFQANNIAPATMPSRICVYLFSGPDYLYADAMFSGCTTYVLQGLEPVVPIPDLLTVPQAALDGTLQNIEISLNTILNFSFFKTKDMREDFQRSQLKGVLPIILVFLARTGKEIQSIEYVSLEKGGQVLNSGEGGVHGAKIIFTDPAMGTQKTLYYFTSDLSNDAIRKNPAVLRFCESLGPTNSLLKAASYLLHEGGFEDVRNFLLRNSSAILEDDSGIPIRYFTPDRWTPRFFGVYTGPINLFKNYYQPDLRQFYVASAPKPLTFGFGYRWNSRSSTLILAVRK